MSELILSDNHREQLTEGSGIGEEAIFARPFFTAQSVQQLQKLGFRGDQAQMVGALVIGIRGVSNEIVGYQLRPETPRLDAKGKPRKYENQTGVPTRLDVPRHFHQRFHDLSIPRLLTEGAKKVSALETWSRKFNREVVGISVAGVGNFDSNELIREDWGKAAPAGSAVYVAYDSDVMTKPQVRKQLRRVGEFLTKRGVSVFYCLFQDVDGRKVGLDDYLLANRDNPDAIDDLLRSATKTVPGAERPSSDFVMEGGKTFRLTYNASGQTQTAIADFEARITCDTRIYGPGNSITGRVYRLEGRTAHVDFLPIDVDGVEFDNMSWTNQWGIHASVHPGRGNREYLRYAIQRGSQETVESCHRFTALGWSKYEGQDVYIHSTGGISAAGVPENFEVRVPDQFTRYSLPPPPVGVNLSETLNGSLEFLPLHVPQVTHILYMALWRSLLGPTNFAIHLMGPTGTFKTSIVLLLLKLTGPDQEDKNLVRADSTQVGLELAASTVGDTLLLVDDYKPTDNPKKAEAIASFIQSLGDGSGRTRGNSDLKVRQSSPPRATVITTGEEHLPGGESTLARTLHIRVPRFDNPSEQITRMERWANRQGGSVATLTSAFLQWSATDLADVRSRIQSDVRNLSSEFAKEVPGCHPRTPKIAAELYAGLLAFVRFSEETGISDETTMTRLKRDCREVLIQVMYDQKGERRDEDPVLVALSLTDSMLSSETAHLCSAIDGIGCPGENWGWQQTADMLKPVGKKIGWVDAASEKVYLLPDAWYAELRSYSVRTGRPLVVEKREIFTRLVDRGYARRGTEESHGLWLVKVKVGNSRVRVIELPWSAIGRGEDAEINELCPGIKADLSQALDSYVSQAGPSSLFDGTQTDPGVSQERG